MSFLAKYDKTKKFLQEIADMAEETIDLLYPVLPSEQRPTRRTQAGQTIQLAVTKE